MSRSGIDNDQQAHRHETFATPTPRCNFSRPYPHRVSAVESYHEIENEHGNAGYQWSGEDVYTEQANVLNQQN